MECKAEKVTDTLTVYQQTGVFCYGTDAVMLVDYVSENIMAPASKNMCDLCSGTGIIPLMLCDRFRGMKASLVEINPKAAELSKMSAKESGLSEQVSVFCMDLKTVKEHFAGESLDFVTCNPPYMTASSGKMCDNEDITIARHEIACTISDVFAAAFHLLKTGGCIYLVYRTDRLSSLMDAAKKNRFEIKDLRFYKMKQGSDFCELLVCKAKKNAKEGMKVETVAFKKNTEGEGQV